MNFKNGLKKICLLVLFLQFPILSFFPQASSVENLDLTLFRTEFFPENSYSRNAMNNIKNFQLQYFSNFRKSMSKAYPKNYKGFGYDFEKALWYITLTNGNKTADFFYSKERFLTTSKLNSWQNYNPANREYYSKKLISPSDLSPLEVQLIQKIGRKENRRKQKSSSYDLIQDFIFGTETRKKTEAQLVTFRFLDWKISTHKAIQVPLKNVERKLLEAAKSDASVKRFVEQPHTISGYNWREVRDTYLRSSHSWGLAIDYMPEKMNGKLMYWRWTRDFYQDDWVLQPLKKRWLPGHKVVEIFESEGFVWGGKWELWDNMHFEYHPEQVFMNQF